MYAGKPLNGEKGIFAPLLKHFLEAALEGELESHLKEEKAAGLPNRLNGKTTKRVKSLSGEFDLQSNRGRSGSFEPVVLPKTSSDHYRGTGRQGDRLIWAWPEHTGYFQTHQGDLPDGGLGSYLILDY